ncbi:hypothetical protein DV737_g2200, partial [Chaetothyriales sp. CBS 132003]
MKQRFSSADVRVIASELGAHLITLRLSNVYDLSSRIFLLKFAKPARREQLLVDSGFRCHLTSFTRTAASAPSAFVSRLRKYLKTRRVTSVSQVGTDRVIELAFSDGQYRLFLEFFAAGNIVLTDADLNVLALLRQVNEGDEAVDVRVGGKYVLDAKQNYHGLLPVTEERARAALDKAQERVKAAQEIGGKKAKRAKGGDGLRKALSAGFPEYPPQLLEHVFTIARVDPSWKISDVLNNPSDFDKIMLSLSDAATKLQNLGQQPVKGYIIAKIKADSNQPDSSNAQPDPSNAQPDPSDAQPSRDAVLYDDFQPFRPAQFENKAGIHIFEFDGFNRTVDEFYSSIESQRLESRLNEHELAARRKLQKAKDEHEKRLGALQQVQELHIRKAQAIEANTHRVEEACAAVNGLIGQGMDWIDIARLLENEQGRGNVVATIVKLPLKLEENTVTLLLDEPGFEEDHGSDEEDRTDDEDDSDEEAAEKEEAIGDRRLAIDIDLALSPWANARQYYDQKKQAAVKEQKTAQASTKALKSTEKKIQEDLKKGLKQEKDILRPARRQFWFEKFLWFVSSDGYLVLGGKDAQQNELLYRRYLNKGDIFVHADLHGASSVIVKNNPQTPDAPVPPSTLSQAGALAVCTSSAWDSKAVMAAWWVNADQVSKTAQTGEYLATGGFMVRGKKNFLPPSQLLLGFGVMWLISEESRVNHGKHRLVKTERIVSGDAEALPTDTQETSVDDTQETSVDDHHVEEANTAQQEVNSEKHADGVENSADNVREQGQENDEAKTNLETTEDSQGENREADDPPSDTEEAERSNPLQPNDHPSGTVRDFGSEPDDGDNGSEGVEDEGRILPLHSTVQAPSGTSTPRSSTPSTTTAKNKAVGRGKRSKAKRAAKKYEWQDEEDRQLAMSLLGSNKAAERKQVEEEDRVAKQAKMEADRERRRKQHEKKAERERERAARIERGEVIEEGEVDAEQLEQERKEHANIDLLVPAAEPGDELIAAVPVVAPWGALGRFKYKVKLQPGGVKKGKAVKEIVGAWTALASRGRKVFDAENKDKERVWAKEVDLIKAWRVEEVVGSLPVKGVRVVQGGGLGGGGSGTKHR